MPTSLEDSYLIGMTPEDGDTDEGSSQFDFDTIKTATDGFSEANKLGEGGFGVVYKVSDQEFENFDIFPSTHFHSLNCLEYVVGSFG